ncbi:MAG: bifunctional diaminohydroxyphosphoribosylaminopyrimidine deaminase/5-amino-6-(5-phosphoribosylamino)uracil reductase RibD [Candidatus Dormibacteria bacterium]
MGDSGPDGADRWAMGVALELARSCDYATSPNPMVGAVVVRDGEIVGRGRTAPAGGPHAEVTALREAGGAARGATLVVSLEPCCHRGRTPPCTEAVVAAGISRCVAALQDPNPLVSGEGLESLRRAGIEVTVGVEAEAARLLNEQYLRWVTAGLPFVTAKFAASLDGRIATASGESRWITGGGARRLGHLLRHRHDAVLVGVGTVLADDPELSARLEGRAARQPLRVVLDSRLSLPPGARVLGGGSGCLIATTDAASAPARRTLEAAGARVVAFTPAADGRVPLDAVLRLLAEEGRISVLVEGGSRVHGAVFDGELADRVVAVIAPRIVGGDAALSAVGGRGVTRLGDALPLTDLTVERAGEDVVVSGYCVRRRDGAPPVQRGV